MTVSQVKNPVSTLRVFPEYVQTERRADPHTQPRRGAPLDRFDGAVTVSYQMLTAPPMAAGPKAKGKVSSPTASADTVGLFLGLAGSFQGVTKDEWKDLLGEVVKTAAKTPAGTKVKKAVGNEVGKAGNKVFGEVAKVFAKAHAKSDKVMGGALNPAVDGAHQAVNNVISNYLGQLAGLLK